MSEHDTQAIRLDEEGIPLLAGLSPSRRAFLKLAGFSFGVAVLPGCSRGEEHDIVPFHDKPEEVTPGTSAYYATQCGACPAACGVVAKVRDGRPIKIEGNSLHPFAGGKGSTCAVGQASILSLYDGQRLKQPLVKGNPGTWDAVDGAIKQKLGEIKRAGKRVRFLSGTVNGVTARATIERFLGGFDDSKHVSYDALSSSAMLDAYEALYGERMLPRFRLENARVIVSVDADFLGTWVAPVDHTRGWQAARNLDAGATAFCHHVQFESRVSLTGTNADRRVVTAPRDLPLVVSALAERVAGRKGTKAPWAQGPAPKTDPALLDEVAERLATAPAGSAVVVCDVDDANTQRIAAYLNHLLGADDASNKQRVIDLDRPSLQRTGDDRALAALRDELAAGEVGALFIAGCNPLFDLPDAETLREGIAQVDLVVSFAERVDETASVAHYVCPDHHPLEAWGDAEPVKGTITVSQPTIAPLGQTRAVVESLAKWSGDDRDDRAIMRAVWKTAIFPNVLEPTSFDVFWNQSLHDGFCRYQVEASSRSFDAGALESPAAWKPDEQKRLDLVLYPKVAMTDGRHAHNPWLQELPDPVSKVSWDNYACLSPATAKRLGVEDGDIVKLEADGAVAVSLPALVQVGQADDTVAVALGYGRQGTGRFHDVGPDWIEATPTVEPNGIVGVNAAPLAGAAVVAIKKTGLTARLARTQLYHSLDVPAHLAPDGKQRRNVASHTTLSAYREDPSSGVPHPHAFDELWEEDHPYKGNHWGLAIDLSACTGCASCVIACQAENNIPVVGKDEVRRQREMHWLRIDRYFQGEGDELETIHQPMMCQQCDHAPCETVCPVLATVHGSEGLNQQVYNRCVGTRYCSNNCPYKVRRFNWFDYPREDRLQNMVLNPDVTVRSRGVMEKCTFCIQRIQEAKATAKREGRGLRDGDIQTACMQACPADAIVFGNTNDPKSSVTAQMKSPRAAQALGEIGVKPSVAYLTRVADKPDTGEGEKHG